MQASFQQFAGFANQLLEGFATFESQIPNIINQARMYQGNPTLKPTADSFLNAVALFNRDKNGAKKLIFDSIQRLKAFTTQLAGGPRVQQIQPGQQEPSAEEQWDHWRLQQQMQMDRQQQQPRRTR